MGLHCVPRTRCLSKLSGITVKNLFLHPKYCCTLKFKHIYKSKMSPKDADGMANSADPYQTAPAYMSKNL